jgi:hypothetical protein
MDPTVWGSKLWFFIHTIALNFPDNPTYQDIKNYESFFDNLKYIIPCEACRMHYIQRQNNNPVSKYLTDSNTLFKYTVDLHNEVNKSLDKRIFSYDEVAKLYRNHYNSNNSIKKMKNNIFNKKNLSIVVIIAILAFLMRYYSKKYTFKIIKSI